MCFKVHYDTYWFNSLCRYQGPVLRATNEQVYRVNHQLSGTCPAYDSHQSFYRTPWPLILLWNMAILMVTSFVDFWYSIDFLYNTNLKIKISNKNIKALMWKAGITVTKTATYKMCFLFFLKHIGPHLPVLMTLRCDHMIYFYPV